MQAVLPDELVLEYVSDYRDVPEWLLGVTVFHPVAERVRGVGARRAGEMLLGPKVLQSMIEVVEREQDRGITVESVRGGGSVSGWRSDPASRHETRLSVNFHYVLAGAVRASALLSEPVVGEVIRHAEVTLRRRAKESYFGDG